MSEENISTNIVGNDVQDTQQTVTSTENTPTPADGQDFVTDEAKLPTQETADTTTDFQWVLDKYKNEAGEFDTNKAAEAYASLTKKLSDKDMLAPEDASGYEIDWGENPVFDDESMVAIQETFKELDLPAKYAGPLAKAYAEEVEAIREQVQQRMEEGSIEKFTSDNAATALKETWGKDFDTNLKAANRAISNFYEGDIAEHPELANNPAFAQIMANIGKQLSEDSAPSSTGRAPSVTDEEVEALMKSPSYWEDMNDKNSTTYKKMTRYFSEQ